MSQNPQFLVFLSESLSLQEPENIYFGEEKERKKKRRYKIKEDPRISFLDFFFFFGGLVFFFLFWTQSYFPFPIINFSSFFFGVWTLESFRSFQEKNNLETLKIFMLSFKSILLLKRIYKSFFCSLNHSFVPGYPLKIYF